MLDFWKKMFKCKILVFELMSILCGTHFQMLFEKVRKRVLVAETKDG